MYFLSMRLLCRSFQQGLTVNALSTSLRALSVGTYCQHQQRVQPDLQQQQQSVVKRAVTDHANSDNILKKIDEQVAVDEAGRLFAVVHLCGKQFKITSGDIILVEGYWPPNIGDKVRLEKVLLAGARDFTLIGRPFLMPGIVDVTATIIEKTTTHIKTHFRKRRRKQFMRTNFQRSPNTMIRINTIEIKKNLQQLDNKNTNSNSNDYERRIA